MKKNTIIVIFNIVFLLFPVINNAIAQEINIRMLPNKVKNDITHIRLQSILSKDKKKADPLGGKQTRNGFYNEDCSLNIGNNITGQSLLSKPQTIIITGPVINRCR